MNQEKSEAILMEYDRNVFQKDFPILANVRNRLMELSEPEYQAFSAKLLPGTENILGVRLPLLRKEAKKIVQENWRAYLGEAHLLQNRLFFEEIMLEGMVIGQLKVRKGISFQEIFSLITDFIPMIDNWSVCDSFCTGLKITKSCPKEMWDFLTTYLKSEQEYSVRFAAVMLLDYYIDAEHIDAVIALLDSIRHPGYYAKMAVAWALSMCYVKFPEKTLSYFQGENSLDDFTYNKAIQKTTESLKVNKAEKAMLRAMKRKS